MNIKFLYILFICVAIVLSSAILTLIEKTRNACTDKGGIYISLEGYKISCVKKDSIIILEN